MIALEHLHVINVIHQEGSFTKASEKLYKARSAVSYSVKQVEEFYDIEIFNRETYRPELTRDGKILLNKIQHLLHEANEFDQFAKQLNSEVESEIRLSISAIFPMNLVTQLLAELKATYPQTIIHLNIETASGERMLKDELVDIGIYGGMQKDNDIQYRQIEQFKLPVYVSDRFQANDIRNVQPEELAQLPQVVVKSSYGNSPDTNIMRDGIQWYVSDQQTKKAIILSGLGWGRLPEHEANLEKTDNKLFEVKSQETMQIPIYVAKVKSKSLGPVGNMIWNFFSLIK